MLPHAHPPDPLPITIVSILGGTRSGEKREARIGLTLTSRPGQRNSHTRKLPRGSNKNKSHQGKNKVIGAKLSIESFV